MIKCHLTKRRWPNSNDEGPTLKNGQPDLNLMSVFEWLIENAPGFEALSDDERTALTEFSFLWSLFEAKSLNEHGNANAIVESARQWAEASLLTEDSFSCELSYFCDRYVVDGEFTRHFRHLHLRTNDAPDLVKGVLKRENARPEDIAATVLIVVYRFRNNLFHGRKWSYELQGQLENFRYANSALMQAIELQDLSASDRIINFPVNDECDPLGRTSGEVTSQQKRNKSD